MCLFVGMSVCQRLRISAGVRMYLAVSIFVRSVSVCVYLRVFAAYAYADCVNACVFAHAPLLMVLRTFVCAYAY